MSDFDEYALNKYMRENRRQGPPPLVKRIHCKDGFSMSVQASEYAYCEPRIDDAVFYLQVEVGFPSEKEPLLMQYAEEPDRPINTVYGYVPVDVVAEVVRNHGGILTPMQEADE